MVELLSVQTLGETGQKRSHLSPPTDSVRSLTLCSWPPARASTVAGTAIEPFISQPRSSAALANGGLFSFCRNSGVFRRTYGRDNRVLHTARLSQCFKVGPASGTWQGAGVSTGCTKIG